MKKLLLSVVLFSSILFAGGNIAPVAEEPIVEEVSSWNFELSPYLAMSSISGTSGIGRPTVADVNLDFNQISDALEFGVAAHFEALHNSGWGLWLDYNYVSLGGTQAGPLGLNIFNVDIKQAVFESLGMYRQELTNGTMDYMAGIRNWRMKVTTDFLINRQVDENWLDFIVGARWTTNLSQNWKFHVRGDIGAGGSDFTATAAAGFRYSFNEWLDFDIQYKSLWVDYETGTPNTLGYFKYDTTTYGPILGVNFKF